MLEAKIPSDVVSQRHQYINALKSFLEDQRQKLTNVYEELGFCLDDPSRERKEDEDEDDEKGVRSVCPYDKNHIIPEGSFKSHTEVCKLLKAGFQKDELPTQLQDIAFCYENKESIMTVNIDESSLNKIIWDQCVKNGQVYTGHRNMPISYIDSSVNLTQEDRLAVYQHVVETSHKAGRVMKVDRDDDELLTTDWERLVKKGLLDEQSNQQYSSKLEQLAALRDLKRRRQTYRAKNVHITKKSYTQIIREVISNQMEILAPEKPGTSSTRQSELQDDDRSYRSYEKRESYSSVSKEFQEGEIRRDRKYNRSPESFQRKRHSEDYRHRHKSRSNRESSSSDYRHGKPSVEAEDSFVDMRYEHSSERKDGEPGESRSSLRRKDRGEADSPNRSSKRDRKRSRSDSEDGGRSSDERHEKSKHKKTKHKKKHSKKYKKR